jgi:hypothetical protein
MEMPFELLRQRRIIDGKAIPLAPYEEDGFVRRAIVAGENLPVHLH